MGDWIEHKYVGLLSNRLEHFKRKSSETYTFRCPLCGDSQKSKIKTRGYIYPKGGKLRFYCHNCGASMFLGQLIKALDTRLYEEFVKEVFVENTIKAPPKQTAPDVTKIVVPRYLKNSPLKDLKKISQLQHDHAAKRYVDSRKIPFKVQFKLFFSPKFKTWVNSFLPNKFENTDIDGPRLVIPLLDKQGNFFGCQGRSLSNETPRYITIIVDENKPRIFGLDTCDLNKYTYCFEGPIDSLFIDNSIAMCGSDLSSSTLLNKQSMTVCFDNEPRSKQIVNKIEKYISSGYNVCLWPDSVKGKDVNEMILNGHCTEELKILIDKNTFCGLDAMLHLQSWRKC